MRSPAHVDAPSDAGEPPVAALADHLFRHEAGRMVAMLTGIFGIERLHMAEDVVQEALLRALKVWPYYGVPAHPAAWLMQTAKHLAIDLLRREKNLAGKQPQIVAFLEQRMAAPVPGEAADELEDDRLKLMFACCHPALPQEAQTALALKTICGFSPSEIAKAFLVSEAAVAKRLTRARRRLQDDRVPFAIPAGPDLPARLERVLQILYLLFNEGYKASSGEAVVRGELCREAIRLGLILVRHPAGDHPITHALLALMFLNGSRLAARADDAGRLLRLSEQDRTRWDRQMIRQGVLHLERAAAGEMLGDYHLEAAIAACHCLAPNEASTDWPRILTLYDRLLERNGSPVVALNRAVVVARVHGPGAGIAALDALPRREQLDHYHLFHSVLGDLEWQCGEFARASSHFRRALRLAESRPERDFLARRLNACERSAPKKSRADCLP